MSVGDGAAVGVLATGGVAIAGGHIFPAPSPQGFPGAATAGACLHVSA